MVRFISISSDFDIEAPMTIISPIRTTREAPPVVASDDLLALVKAAGDTLRLDVLRVLRDESFGVLELCHIFDTAQPGMSHHLKVLSNAGLVTTRREGNSVFYRRNHPHTDQNNDQLIKSLFASVDDLVLGSAIQKRIEEVNRQRAETSELFFADHNPKKFKQQQDMIAAFDVYRNQVVEVLHKTAFEQTQAALEIGPGEGEFLPVLGQKFTRVVALDNSQSMLAKAKSYCADKNLNNIEFVFNDSSYCYSQPQGFDCVVINMVLHHTPSPAQIIADVSAALKPGGRFIVCELCSHNQDWAREACGDLWLGIDPNDLSRWTQDNYLHENQNMYFALRNGFQIQVRQFTKILM